MKGVFQGTEDTRIEHAGKPRVQGGRGKKSRQKSILGDRGRVRVRVLKIRCCGSPISGRQPGILAPKASAAQLWLTACGLELAENVRLNNFLSTAVQVPDALQIAELSDIDLLQDGILPFRIAVICFHGIWKPARCNGWLLLADCSLARSHILYRHAGLILPRLTTSRV